METCPRDLILSPARVEKIDGQQILFGIGVDDTPQVDDLGVSTKQISINKYPLTFETKVREIVKYIPNFKATDQCKYDEASQSDILMASNSIALNNRRGAGNILIANDNTYNKLKAVAEELIDKRFLCLSSDVDDDMVYVGYEGNLNYDRSIVWFQDGTIGYNQDRLDSNWVALKFKDK